MSNYLTFIMMQTCLILIILGFTDIVSGWDITLTNITYNDSYPVCPVSLFRRKRAYTEYTRWRASLETTPEFLVKVLDEDLTTANTRPIVAVNIQPVTRGVEKIIVGGVIVPPVTTPQIIPEVYRNYTRFVPPTTMPVSRVSEDLYLAPLTPSLDIIPPIKPNAQYGVGRYSQRDESPPASPQFLPRTVPPYARQYAPIEAVAFTRRPTDYVERKPAISYIPQRTLDISTKISRPTRTSPLPDIIWPQRTTPIFDNIVDLQNFIDADVSHVSVTKTSLQTDRIRTSTINMDVNEEFPMPSQTYENGRHDDDDIKNSEEENRKYEEQNKKLDDENREYEKEYRKSLMNRLYEGQSKKKEEQMIRKSSVSEKRGKDSDVMYSMFYGDEDNESNKKHVLYYEERPDMNTESALTTESDLDDYDKKPTTETTTEPEYDNEENTNLKQNESSNFLFGINAELSTPSSKGRSKNVPKRICSLIKLRNLNFNSPHTLAEIQFQLRRWADKSPLVKLEDITEGNLTAMENPIYLMSVDDPSSGQIVSAKQTVMIVAGIQGRDHHAVAAAMYVLYQLIERTETHTDLLTKYRFWIIPVFNPDGYDYSMTFPHRREWMKNLRQNWENCNRESCSACEQYGLLCTVQPCYGVNLDRNFEYQWIPAEALRAEHPCGSLYAGARQLSEEETRALTQYLHNKRMLLVTFIAFKEGEVLGIMYPYSHTRKLRAFDQIYRQRASRAASAAYSINGRPYVAGQTSEFLPLYAGGIEDWVDGHLGIDHTYTIMMFRTTDSYNTKLITERVVHEGFAAMDTLLLQSVTTPLSPPNTLKRANSSPKQHTTQQFIIIFLIATTLQVTFY